jgi:ribosomal protein L40E
VKNLLYQNELCNGCKKTIESADDIVVCPVCGTPQHRTCWLEHKTCVNEARHAEGFLWQAAEGENATSNFDPKKDIGKVCVTCGTNNPTDAKICTDCKKDLVETKKELETIQPEITTTTTTPTTTTQPPSTSKTAKVPPFLAGVSSDEVIGGVKAHDIALYVQFGAKRYLEKFRKSDLTDTKFSWSWVAFLFTPYWFFYRKLYWLGGIFWGLTFAISIFFSALLVAPLAEIQALLPSVPLESVTLDNILDILTPLSSYTPVLLGMFATQLVIMVTAALLAVPSYKKKVITDITSIRRFAKEENVINHLVIRRGGASGLALLGSVLAYDLLRNILDQIVRQLKLKKESLL